MIFKMLKEIKTGREVIRFLFFFKKGQYRKWSGRSEKESNRNSRNKRGGRPDLGGVGPQQVVWTVHSW